MRLHIGALVSIVSIAVSLPAQAGDLYGAIAYSKSDGQWGHAYDYGSESEANRTAMGHCRDAGGRSCEIAMRVVNGCGAVARTSSTRDWVAATGLTRASAERAALNKCRDFYGKNCVIEVWSCTSR